MVICPHGFMRGSMASIRLTVRVDLGSGRALGPGKIRLLEAIDRSGSISEAGRSLKMSYRRTWLLVDDMNGCFRGPVVATKPGGAHGGGAELTALGQELIKKYRSIEAEATSAAGPHLRTPRSIIAPTRLAGPEAPERHQFEPQCRGVERPRENCAIVWGVFPWLRHPTPGSASPAECVSLSAPCAILT